MFSRGLFSSWFGNSGQEALPITHFVIDPRDDPVNSPAHYTGHPSGVECIEITEHMNFNLGNVVKYLWRADHKGAALQDLKKAQWYLEREIQRMQRHAPDRAGERAP